MANAAASEAAASEGADEELDTRWLDQYKAAEAKYNNFYKEPTTSIRLYLLYIKANELSHMDKSQCFLEKGLLRRDRIVALIKHHEMREGIKYKLNALFRYNIDLEPEEISDFINADVSDTESNRFMTSEKYLNDIHYKDSIHMLQDLNALYFMYSEDIGSRSNQTKKITWLTNKKHKTLRNNHKKNLKVNKELL